MIRRDGSIAYRQIAREKDDRLDSAQLLAIVDKALGTSGNGARGGFVALSRLQLGIEATTSVGEDVRALGASVRFALPLGRFAFGGLRAGYNSDHVFDGGVLAGLRLPMFGDTSAIQLTAIGGLAKTTPYAGAQIGLWLAWTPMWGINLDAGATTERELVFTLGVSRLISWR